MAATTCGCWGRTATTGPSPGILSAQAATSAGVPEVRVCYDVANGNVYLTALNTGGKGVHLTVRAKAYRNDGPWNPTVAAGASQDLHWDLKDSARWYDFVVTCAEQPGWSRRFAGRVETGQDGLERSRDGHGRPLMAGRRATLLRGAAPACATDHDRSDMLQEERIARIQALLGAYARMSTERLARELSVLA